MMKPVIALTVGDHNGIGPEVVLKALLLPSVRSACRPLLVGPLEAFRFYARRFKIPVDLDTAGRDTPPTGRGEHRIRVRVSQPAPVNPVRIVPGNLSAPAGRISRHAIEEAVRLIRQGEADAMVTAPVSKKAMRMGGSRFPGQTEMLQHLTGARSVAMVLESKHLRIGLATIHAPIRALPALLTRRLLRERIAVIIQALVRDWGVQKPRIGVLALNPHAGEGGEIGTEEERVIAPVLREFRRRHVAIEGPFPADGFFARTRPGSFDAIVAMYHDQGLIPLKMTARGTGVNVTAGLPIVRTSPDHGTAFDIAGRGCADPSSMAAAILLAARIARHRARNAKRRTR